MAVLLTIISLIFFLWLSILTIIYWRRLRILTKITTSGQKKDLTEILNSLQSLVSENRKEIDTLQDKIAKLKKQERQHIQKIGFVKFNPFADTGGEQSFVLSLLDADDNGVIFTVLHARSGTRWYTKMINRGKSKGFDLSQEEKEAIKKAQSAD